MLNNVFSMWCIFFFIHYVSLLCLISRFILLIFRTDIWKHFFFRFMCFDHCWRPYVGVYLVTIIRYCGLRCFFNSPIFQIPLIEIKINNLAGTFTHKYRRYWRFTKVNDSIVDISLLYRRLKTCKREDNIVMWNMLFL